MTTPKPLCSFCQKEKGTVRCEGCVKLFCYQHLIEHREGLNKSLDEVELSHNLIYESLTQLLTSPTNHEYMKRMDQWEEESIAKIRKAAEEARNTIMQALTDRLEGLKASLEVLTNEIRQSRQSNDFLETDLDAWQRKLNDLKESLNDREQLQIREGSTTLVSMLQVDTFDASESFERSSGNTAFEDDFKVVVKDASEDHTEVRGKREYQRGQRTLRMKIEQLSSGGWILFGINSKATALQSHSYNSSSNYSWSNGNQIYQGGVVTNTASSDVTNNDTVRLLIDCDRCVIQLINERTNHTLEMPVDISKCPFPWQLHLNLYHPSTKVRILA